MVAHGGADLSGDGDGDAGLLGLFHYFPGLWQGDGILFLQGGSGEFAGEFGVSVGGRVGSVDSQVALSGGVEDHEDQFLHLPERGGVDVGDGRLEELATREVIADKAYDSNAIRRWLGQAGIGATISPKRNRKKPPWYDPVSYRTRHLVENLFADLKQFRGIATRYCKLGESYEAFINAIGWFLDTKAVRRAARPPVYKKPPNLTNGQIVLL